MSNSSKKTEGRVEGGRVVKRAALRLIAAMIAVTVAAIACRQEPRTPPNMPVPEIQKTDNGETPSSPPSPLPKKDAG